MGLYRLLHPEKQPHVPDDNTIHLLLEICLLTFQIKACADDCRNGKNQVSSDRLFRIKTYLETAFDLFCAPAESFTEESDEGNP